MFNVKHPLIRLMYIWVNRFLKSFGRALLTFSSRSPQDQAVLEAEYKQNPKPNKAARAEIVKKVSLNEKEVQVGKYV
jgi:Homeodomain